MVGQAAVMGAEQPPPGLGPRDCGHLNSSSFLRGTSFSAGEERRLFPAGDPRSPSSRSRLAGLSASLPKLRGTAFGHGPALFQFNSADRAISNLMANWYIGGSAAVASNPAHPLGGGSHQFVEQLVNHVIDRLPAHPHHQRFAVAVSSARTIRFGFDGIAAASCSSKPNIGQRHGHKPTTRRTKSACG